MKASHIGVIAGAALILIMVILAVFAGSVSKYDPISTDVSRSLEFPSSRHLFGTDRLGRDVFSRVLHGLREDLKVGVFAVLLALVGGSILGVLSTLLEQHAGILGKAVSNCITMYARFISAGPGILLLIAIVTFRFGSTVMMVIGIALVLVPGFIRVIGGIFKRRKNTITLGIAGIVCAIISTNMALAIMLFAAMGFLGLGIRPPMPELGALIAEGRNHLRNASYAVIYPGMTLFVALAAFYLFGESLNISFLSD